jgi:hypothetical protein
MKVSVNTNNYKVEKIKRTYKPRKSKNEKRCPLCGGIILDKYEVICEACKYETSL